MAVPVNFKLGFSLVELMIVLAILVSIAAIAVPNLQRSFQRNELQEAGRLLQETLGELRQESLQTGRPLFVQFGWDSASIRVFRDAVWQAEVRQAERRAAEQGGAAAAGGGLSGGLSGGGLSGGGLSGGSVPTVDRPLEASMDLGLGSDLARRQLWESSETHLATDVWFSQRRVVLDAASSASSGPTETASPAANRSGGQTMLGDSPPAMSEATTSSDATLGPQPSGWSKPLAILPNGSVGDFYFWMQLDRSWQCPVLWRGATGQLEIGPAQRVRESTAASDARVSM